MSVKAHLEIDTLFTKLEAIMDQVQVVPVTVIKKELLLHPEGSSFLDELSTTQPRLVFYALMNLLLERVWHQVHHWREQYPHQLLIYNQDFFKSKKGEQLVSLEQILRYYQQGSELVRLRSPWTAIAGGVFVVLDTCVKEYLTQRENRQHMRDHWVAEDYWYARSKSVLLQRKGLEPTISTSHMHKFGFHHGVGSIRDIFTEMMHVYFATHDAAIGKHTHAPLISAGGQFIRRQARTSNAIEIFLDDLRAQVHRDYGQSLFALSGHKDRPHVVINPAVISKEKLADVGAMRAWIAQVTTPIMGVADHNRLRCPAALPAVDFALDVVQMLIAWLSNLHESYLFHHDGVRQEFQFWLNHPHN